MATSEERRRTMVQNQLVARGIADRRLLDAMLTVPRESFVSGDLARSAYDDAPLPIGEGQTISQPYIVATMIEALEVTPSDRALEIGAGSGYAAAVLGLLAHEVFAVERSETLARLAQERIRALRYDNVHVRCGDGTLGWAEHAPYGVILVSACAPEIPQSLLDQLAIGGRLVIPLATGRRGQELFLVRRADARRYHRHSLGGVRFVPLIGSHDAASPASAKPDGDPTPTPHRVHPDPRPPPLRSDRSRSSSPQAHS